MSIAASSVSETALSDANNGNAKSKVPPKRQTIAASEPALVPEAR